MIRSLRRVALASYACFVLGCGSTPAGHGGDAGPDTRGDGAANDGSPGDAVSSGDTVPADGASPNDAAPSTDGATDTRGDADAGSPEADAMLDGGGDAGPPAVHTIVSTPVRAGDTLAVTCQVTGTTAPALITVDTGAAVLHVNGPIIVTKAGPIRITCSVPSLGLVDATPVTVTVDPGLPAKLVLSRSPDALSYTAGAQVMVTAVADDAWGNPCPDAVLTHAVTDVFGTGVASEPQAGTFQLPVDGTYRVTYNVDPPTAGGVPVSAFVDLLIDDGPSITCDGPADLAAVTAGVGPVAFSGTVSDVNGLTSEVTVNGTPAPVTNGGFQASVDGTFGMNFVDVVATNSLGFTARRTCTFLDAGRWLSPETGSLADGVSFALEQGAVDDGTRTGGLNTPGDLVYAVANSPALATAVDGTLKAANPLKPQGCDQMTCSVFGCVCFYDSGIDYQSVSIPGPNPTTLTLVVGGFQLHTHITGLHFTLHVYGDAINVPYDTTGTVDFAFIDLDYTADIALAGGRLHVTPRPNTIVTTPGLISPNFPGVNPWIVNNVIVPFAQGSFATMVKNAVQTYVTTEQLALLDGTFANTVSENTGPSRAVPALDGAASKTLAFALDISSVDATSSRLLIGAGTALSSTAAQSRPPMQVALPSSTSLFDPSVSSPSTAAQATYVGVLEQFLHALWRAGYLHASLTLTSGAKVDLDAMLPPVVSTDPPAAPTDMKLAFGGLALTVNDPGLPANLKARVGGTVTLSVAPTAAGLQASSPAVTELHVDVDGAVLSSAQTTLLSQRASELLATIAPVIFNNAFDALPLLVFPVPNVSVNFGVGPATLGLTAPSFSLAPDRFVEGGDVRGPLIPGDEQLAGRLGGSRLRDRRSAL